MRTIAKLLSIKGLRNQRIEASWNVIVTKKDIVRTISEQVGLTQLQAKVIVQKTFDAIIETLVENGRVELRNFGVFEARIRPARVARNPRTGEEVAVPAKFVVNFKPGKEMEARVKRYNPVANLPSATEEEDDRPPDKAYA